MIELTGIKISEFPFFNLEMVGTLLYHEFPSTLVYANKNKEPIIVEWVDCSDDRQTHKYLAYKTTIKNLSQYIYGFLSHYDLIKLAIDNIIISYEGEIGNEVNSQFILFKNLPKSYLPNKKVFFKSSDGVELKDIIKYFELEKFFTPKEVSIRENHLLEKDLAYQLISDKADVYKLVDEKNQKILLKVVADEERSEVINLHIKEGKTIGNGTADTYVLGRLLTTFDDLYREASLDNEEGTQRDNLRSINSARGKALYSKISTRVVLTRAASFSIFIRPVEDSLIDNTNISVIEKIFSLFDISKDAIKLTQSKDSYSNYVYKSYKEFLEVIKTSDVDIECNTYNPFSDKSIDQEFVYEKAEVLLNNIKTLITTEQEKLVFIVKFKALNCNTGHYTLMKDDGKELKGHFDKQIRASMDSLTFTDFYEVTINRDKIHVGNNIEPKLQDTIISCIKL